MPKDRGYAWNSVKTMTAYPYSISPASGKPPKHLCRPSQTRFMRYHQSVLILSNGQYTIKLTTMIKV